VPMYLQKKRYIQFALYSLYTAIISLYLELIVLLFAFIYLGNFSFQNMGPNASDTILLAVILYLLVIIGVLLLMVRQEKESRQVILAAEKNKNENPFLEIMSNRKMARIPYSEIVYIESLSDYIRVNTMKEQIISKEKISNLASRLPDAFIRIHRSFIINKEKIKSISYDEVMVEDVALNIGRSYRKGIKEKLKSE
jgi:two-component system, LytTR family, response regulator LytT